MAGVRCRRRRRRLGGDAFPNPRVYSHTGETFRFHTDLVLGRVVVINFMSILQHPLFPATEHLLLLAERLGPRLGSEVHFYSISMDPDHDTPRRLRAFAAEYGVPPGWLFLTAAAIRSTRLSLRLFKTKAAVRLSLGAPGAAAALRQWLGWALGGVPCRRRCRPQSAGACRRSAFGQAARRPAAARRAAPLIVSQVDR